MIPGQFAGEMGAHRNPMFVNYSPSTPNRTAHGPSMGFSHARGGENPRGICLSSAESLVAGGMDARRFNERLDLLGTIGEQRQSLERGGRKRGL